MANINTLLPITDTILSGIQISATQANYLANSVAGTAVLNSCVTLDASKNSAGINSLSSSAISVSSTISSPDITDGIATISSGNATGLTISGGTFNTSIAGTSIAQSLSASTTTIPSSNAVKSHIDTEILARDPGGIRDGNTVLNVFSTSSILIYVTAWESILQDISGNSKKFGYLSFPSMQVFTIATTTTSGLDTGTIGANAWYYIYLAHDSITDTTIVLWSLDPNTPDNSRFPWTHISRISLFRMNAGGGLQPFEQFGKSWFYKSTVSIEKTGTLSNYNNLTFPYWISIAGQTWLPDFVPAIAARWSCFFASTKFAMGISPYSSGHAGVMQGRGWNTGVNFVRDAGYTTSNIIPSYWNSADNIANTGDVYLWTSDTNAFQFVPYSIVIKGFELM